MIILKKYVTHPVIIKSGPIIENENEKKNNNKKTNWRKRISEYDASYDAPKRRMHLFKQNFTFFKEALSG